MIHYIIVPFFMVLTILIDLGAIISAPIFLSTTTQRCAEGVVDTGKLHSIQALAWVIFQSLPLFIAYTILFIHHFWSDVIRHQEWMLTSLYLNASRPYQTNNTNNNNNKHNPISTISTLDQKKHLPPPKPQSTSKAFTTHTKWTPPLSTSGICQLTCDDTRPERPITYFSSPHCSIRREFHPTIRAVSHASPTAPVFLPPTLYRPIHPLHYHPAQTLYSAIPGNSELPYCHLRDKWEARAVYTAMGLSALHIGVLIWGAVLFAKHWETKAICPGNDGYNGFLVFLLAYNWFIPIFYALLFVLYRLVN